MVGDNGQNYCTPECLANDILYEEICQKKKALEKLMDWFRFRKFLYYTYYKMNIFSLLKNNKYSLGIASVCTIAGIISIAAGAPIVGSIFLLGGCCALGYFWVKKWMYFR